MFVNQFAAMDLKHIKNSKKSVKVYFGELSGLTKNRF